MGVSTGFMWDWRGDWPKQIEQAKEVSTFAIELSALSEDELRPLLEFLEANERLPFRYLSVHGPSKQRNLPERALVQLLVRVAHFCDGIVMHPDTMDNLEAYRQLGAKLVLENMDSRKSQGRYTEELQRFFDELPDAGFCFDIAHAWSVDQGMRLGDELLSAFMTRLRHVHLSSLSDDQHHIPLTPEHEDLFLPLLSRCLDVPWILEAPAPDSWWT